MTFDHASVRTTLKPWGRLDLGRWASNQRQDSAIGEVSFDYSEAGGPDRLLLLKLLFTAEKLSIQVHPDDAVAKSMGMESGKSEAWYVLEAEEGAQVAVGLKRQLTQLEFRKAAIEGSIEGLLDWQAAAAGDVFYVPAGIVHAVGAGLVIAEIQQRNDTTFRIWDRGRSRELHIEEAVAVARLEPVSSRKLPRHITVERAELMSCPFFTLERLDLPAETFWELTASRESWALVVSGGGTIGSLTAAIGDGFFAEADRADIRVGRDGIVLLIATAASTPPIGLLREVPAKDRLKPDSAEVNSDRVGHNVIPFRLSIVSP
ncbi:class I mannose-6-phosphate isomerase [Rhizobium miluonense]|uniref:Mannose-6-phosphate isomerase n=1 Tax=Rhizobium miluonense TaxID=411945 RepID=A0ABU1SXR1_9HYPH|nr:class I mannose-6-phosphate isomerase [Rhizobium miluonense]MDR6903685.1 mannose-6-phosphate isomerase [Rhizobium miluonense]